MRIAQVSPLVERVPPPAYGGIEQIVSLLTDELVRRGHEVTLFASGDSITSAQLESVHPRALRLDSSVKEYSIYDSAVFQLFVFCSMILQLSAIALPGAKIMRELVILQTVTHIPL